MAGRTWIWHEYFTPNEVSVLPKLQWTQVWYCGVMGPNHTIGFWALAESVGLWPRAWEVRIRGDIFLGLAKRRSSIDLNDQSDLPRSSSDRDVHYKRTRKMGTQKYLRKGCYHSIECFVANFLAALMRKWPLNNNFLAL